MRTFTVTKFVNPCIDVVRLPSDEKRFGVHLAGDSYVLLDRHQPASVVRIGEGHPVIRTAKLAMGPVLTLSEHGLSLDKDPDALVLLNYWIIPDINGFSTCKDDQGCLMVGSAPAEEATVEVGWEDPSQHNRFQMNAWRIRELVRFSVGGYQQVGVTGNPSKDVFPYSDYYVTYDFAKGKPNRGERPKLRILSAEAFRRSHPEMATTA